MKRFDSRESTRGIPAGFLDSAVPLEVCEARAAVAEARRILAEMEPFKGRGGRLSSHARISADFNATPYAVALAESLAAFVADDMVSQ
jgi:hypothetical protein